MPGCPPSHQTITNTNSRGGGRYLDGKCGDDGGGDDEEHLSAADALFFQAGLHQVLPYMNPVCFLLSADV